MTNPLITFLIELATNPSLHEQLSPAVLADHGISDPQHQAALLSRDKPALMKLLGSSTLTLNNNGTVYTLGGTLDGQTDTMGDASLLILDRTPEYNIQLGHNLYGRVLSGVFETAHVNVVDSEEERP